MSPEEKLHNCQFPNCGKSFTRKTNLNKHIDIVHLKLREYCCTEKDCLKKFSDSQHLKLHMMSHTGEKPVHCRYCDQTFSSHANRKDHENRHLQKKYKILSSPSIRPYTCTECQTSFYRKRLLKLHQKSCGPKETDDAGGIIIKLKLGKDNEDENLEVN
mmetsp:Transcript_25646/g.24947  ORF Transcript_25646/g.24947 Transcript_25646/m.24947 type:complete len:159 (+) Transcript_25646:56-532(+)